MNEVKLYNDYLRCINGSLDFVGLDDLEELDNLDDYRAISIRDITTDEDCAGFSVTYWLPCDNYKTHTFILYPNIYEAVYEAILHMAKFYGLYINRDRLSEIHNSYIEQIYA